MKLKLTSKNIDAVSLEMEEYLKSRRTDKKDILRIKFGIEEALSGFREKFGEEAEFDLRYGRVLGKTKIIITVEGDSYDPFADSDNPDENTAFMRSMLSTLGKRPIWIYSGRKNQLNFSVDRRRLSSWVSLVLAILLAIVCWLIVSTFPESAVTLIRDDIFRPLLDTFVGFLNAVAGPMIFLAVVWGIYSMGDANTFSVIGKKLTLRFLIYITVLSVVTGLLATGLFSIDFGAESQGSSFSPIYLMVLDIIPNNLFTPFSRGNTLQILFVAIILGIAMLLIGEKTRNVAIISEQLNLIVQGIMKIVSRLVPFYIFGSLFDILLSSDLSSLSFAGKFFFVTIGACAFVIVVQTVLTSIISKRSPLTLWKKSFGSFLIALTTASSSAAFASNINTCKNEYGIDDRLTNFGVPFVQVLYKPGVSMVYFISALSMAEYSGISVSYSWILTAIVMSIILSAATPAIPGGSLASFSVLFMQLGIPTDNLAVVLGLNVILDFFHTAANIVCGQFMLVDEFNAGFGHNRHI